jgi:DNA-directed RNA polymerase subunit RPC12/RpoP
METVTYRVVKRSAGKFAVEAQNEVGRWRTVEDYSNEADAAAKMAKLKQIALNLRLPMPANRREREGYPAAMSGNLGAGTRECTCPYCGAKHICDVEDRDVSALRHQRCLRCGKELLRWSGRRDFAKFRLAEPEEPAP